MSVFKKVNLFIVASVLSASAFAADPVSATQPAVKPESRAAAEPGQAGERRQPGIAHDGFLQRLKVELSLSDEQMKAIEKIHAEARQQAAENRQNGPVDELQSVMSLEPDSKAFDEAVKKAADAAATNARSRVSGMAENRKKVYAVLDAEQKKKFLTLKVVQQPRPMMQHRQSSGKKSAEQ